MEKMTRSPPVCQILDCPSFSENMPLQRYGGESTDNTYLPLHEKKVSILHQQKVKSCKHTP